MLYVSFAKLLFLSLTSLAASGAYPPALAEQVQTGVKCEWASPDWIAPTSSELSEAVLDCDAFNKELGYVQVDEIGDMGTRDVGDYFSDYTQVPCWAERDPCTGAYKIMGGYHEGVIHTSSIALGSSCYYDGDYNQCDSGSDMGSLDNSYDLVVYSRATAADDSTTDAACLQYKLVATEYRSAGCTGTITRGPYTDQVEYATTAGGTEWANAYCDDKADCAGSWGDSCDGADDWHLPDVLFDNATHPASGTRYYYVSVQVRYCDTDCSSNCSTWVCGDSGCFSVTW